MLKLGQEIMQFTEQFSIYYIFWKINKTFFKTKISKNCQNLFKTSTGNSKCNKKGKASRIVGSAKTFQPKTKSLQQIHSWENWYYTADTQNPDCRLMDHWIPGFEQFLTLIFGIVFIDLIMQIALEQFYLKFQCCFWMFFLSINHERFCSWIIHNSSLLYNGDSFNHWNSISKHIILSFNVCNRFGVYQLTCKMLLNNPQLQSLQWHFFINHWNFFKQNLSCNLCNGVLGIFEIALENF